MNASVSWLNAFADSAKSATELRDLLTAHTATVEELVALRADLASIVVARVVEAAAHPDSDHLHITKVDMGTGELLDVVCGAPNVTAGRMYPFAATGTVLPGQRSSLPRCSKLHPQMARQSSQVLPPFSPERVNFQNRKEWDSFVTLEPDTSGS